MDTSTRRLVAYVAARLHGTNSNSVYDNDRGRYTSISGSVESARVSVFDHDARCYFSGSGSGGRMSLYHYGRGAHVSVNLNRQSGFSGYDHGAASHFSGTVNAHSVSLYDYATGSYHNYSV